MRPTAFVRRVGDKNVTRMDLARLIMLERRRYCRIEGCQKARYSIALGQQIANSISGANGKVGSFVDNRAHAGPQHCIEHLLAQSDERVLNDLKRKDVSGH